MESRKQATNRFASCTTTDELRQAYRRAAVELHPDRGGDPSAFVAMQHDYTARAAQLEAEAEQRSKLKTLGQIGTILTKISRGEDVIGNIAEMIPQKNRPLFDALSSLLKR